MKLRDSGYECWAEDVLQDVFLEIFLNTSDKLMTLMIKHEQSREPHFFNNIRKKLDYRIIDFCLREKIKIRVGIDDSEDYKQDHLLIPYKNLTEEQYALFREVSCNVRPDDFMIPLESGMYVTPKDGWVSGWVHSYIDKKWGKKYTYWQYSAFIRPGGRYTIPKKIKTSASRHEAYMALMDWCREMA